jgi:hypothetical protein
VQALLLTEEEYRNTLEGGGIPPPITKNTKNSDGKAPPTGKATVGSVPPTQYNNERKQKVKYVEPDVLPCQPTSSRVKVEDLVMEEQETDEQATHASSRTFWDRPIPKPQFEWPHDPRMPAEWNEMITSMRAYEGTRPSRTRETYRLATDDEMLEPEDFTNLWQPNQSSYDHLRKQSTVRLKPDEQDLSFKKLRSKFERHKCQPGQPNSQEVPANLKVNKGKRRAEEMPPERDEYSHLRDRWREEYADILDGTRSQLPPWREVNHEIHLIDESKRYTYHLPRCPNSLRDEFHEKVNRYVSAGWWEPKPVNQAAPMLCIHKKDKHLRTVIDARQRNDNTIKDVTPLPDQEVIREDVARAKIRSKIDLSDAYEQVRVRTEDIDKTAFATIAGTFISHIMQQGDCNAPATFQRMMTSIFRDAIGRFMHVYLDDIFIYSNTVEEHEQHLKVVFDRLRANVLYLKWSKCDLYASRIDCLGHIIDDKGIHPDADKLARIREWRTPRNYNDIQRFVGLVVYVGNYLPNVSSYTGPLMAMTQNGAPFHWRPIHQQCFDMIKRICCKTPVIQPIDAKRNEPIWLICDASKSGVGAMYGQGPNWQQCRPAGFMSKKFTTAQQHYAVHELETLAILEALQKWEDKLVGYKIHVITDHKALEFFKTQSVLSHRQRRWMDYMSRFDFDITYIKGELNKVADCLSRYYENDTDADVHEPHDYVRADARIDPTGEDLPAPRFHEITEKVIEIRALREGEMRRSKRLQERREERVIEAQVLAEANAKEPYVPTNASGPTVNDDREAITIDEDVTLEDTLFQRYAGETPTALEDDGFIRNIKAGYSEDKLFTLILEKPQDYTGFSIREGIIRTTNPRGDEVVCVPRNRNLITQLIDQAHNALGHFGDQRTTEYIRRWYWWPQVTKDVREFCKTCEACQRAKGSNQHPTGKLHPLPIPIKPWDSIGMDFIGPFPESKGFNYLWVIICRMTSMVHLIPVHTRMKASELSWIYRREIVRLHGLPSSIVSDRDSKFTSKWWRELHKTLGTKLLMSTSFHPQTDGQTERANRSVGQIFRTVVRHDQKDWIDRVDLTEFAINASISGTTKYAPFELNGGYMPSMIREIRADEVIPKGIKAFATQALQNLAEAHDAIIESRVFQTHSANARRREEPTISHGDLVFLSTKNLNLPKGRASKLCPKYVGPYKILHAKHETSNYTLELPTALQARRLHPTFHVSLLRPYHASDDAMFPNRVHPEPYDFGAADDQEWFVEEIVGHRWVDGNKLELEVRWSLGDTTWEPQEACKQLEALDRYLELHGVKRPANLPKRE